MVLASQKWAELKTKWAERDERMRRESPRPNETQSGPAGLSGGGMHRRRVVNSPSHPLLRSEKD